MKLNVLRADPAGNITLFVLDPIERERRAALAAELMRRLPDMKIDQVGFACPADADTDGRMEMMGGEFCGNATRAYAMYIARQRGGLSEVRLRVSGCDHVVTAAVDLARGAARAEIPHPLADKALDFRFQPLPQRRDNLRRNSSMAGKAAGRHRIPPIYNVLIT